MKFMSYLKKELLHGLAGKFLMFMIGGITVYMLVFYILFKGPHSRQLIGYELTPIHPTLSIAFYSLIFIAGVIIAIWEEYKELIERDERINIYDYDPLTRTYKMIN